MRNAKWRKYAVFAIFGIFVTSLASVGFGADRPGPDGFLIALPGYEYEFPRDHGLHDGYRTEWWYYTGHLTAESGRRYGFELTFFRAAVRAGPGAGASRWELRHLAPAHFAISDIDGRAFRFYEKMNRWSPFTASASGDHLEVFNEGWRVVTAGDGSWRLIASEGGDAIDLGMKADKAPVIHGENGVSVKAAGEGYASHYYSMPRLQVEGTIRAGGRPIERCSGIAWMDHEFGSSALRENQRGWDWFSIQLDNETELMLYIIRRNDGTADESSSGSLVTAEGEVIHLPRDQFRVTPTGRWRSKKSGATYPMGWQVAVPSIGLTVKLQPLLEDQELVTRKSTRITYWEGAVSAIGSMGNIAVRGEGYVEMTGYQRAFRIRP